jgi:hypothetical protein
MRVGGSLGEGGVGMNWTKVGSFWWWVLDGSRGARIAGIRKGVQGFGKDGQGWGQGWTGVGKGQGIAWGRKVKSR